MITSSLIPSRLSHLARVIFKKFIPSTYSQWEVTKLRVFFKNFFSHLFPVGEAIYQGVFEKTFKNSVAARESGYCPFTYSMFESHFVNPLKKISLSNPRLKAVLSTYLSKISPQSLTATFGAEKRHISRNFFQKMFSPLYRMFSDKKRKHFFKKVSYSYTAAFILKI